ncbi:MAG: hypothetical protein AAF141_09140 [Pseudomonadota bacterium]
MNSRYDSIRGHASGADAGTETTRVANYLARPAEQLVLEGYRSWTAACIWHSPAELDRCRELYDSTIDGRAARVAFDALGDFIQSLGRCASCPLKTHLAGCPSVCRDEVMVLGLIAALQIDDSAAADLCLDALSCPAQRQRVEIAALNFAITLRALGHTLLPIPAPVIAQMPNGEPRPAQTTAPLHPTLH